eukprot:gene18712-22383_t
MNRRVPTQWTVVDDEAERLALNRLCDHLTELAESRATNDATALHCARESLCSLYNHQCYPPMAQDLRDMLVQLANTATHPLVVYIRHSNCMLVFHHHQQDASLCRVSVVQIYPEFSFTCLTPKAKMLVPAATFLVPYDRMLVEPFFEHMVYLRDMSTPLPKCSSEIHKDNINHNELKLEAIPTAILEWLLPTVATSTYNSTSLVVTKSVRTDIYNGSPIWRRSPLYIGAKAVLQLILSIYAPANNLVLYKSIMLSFLSKVASTNLSATRVLGDIKERLVKISTRLDKFSAMASNNGHLVAQTLAQCQAINNHLQEQWQDVCMSSESSGQFEDKLGEISMIPYDRCLTHQFITVRSTLNDLQQPHTGPSITSASIPHHTTPFHSTRVSKPSEMIDLIVKSLANWSELGLALYIVEEAIRNHLWTQRDTLDLPEPILNLLETYLIHAPERYKDDPIGNSGMFLAAYTLTAMLDAIACRYGGEIYRSHPPYVNINVLSRIVVTSRDQQEHLQQVVQYFSNRVEKSIYKVCLDTSIFSVSRNGLPFSWANDHLIADLNRTRLADGMRAKDKRDQILQLQVDQERNMAYVWSQYEATPAPLGFHEIDRRLPFRNEYYRLQDQTAPLFEHSLPEDTTAALVALFCINTPKAFDCVRSAMALLGRACVPGDLVQSVYITVWPKTEGLLGLVSQSKSWVETHYKVARIFKEDPAKFIVQCGLKVTEMAYMPSKHLIPSIEKWDITAKCTIQVPASLNQLQWLVNGGHFENDVLASLYNTPPSMTEREYIAFGAVRAGGNLQIRNMARAIDSGVLDVNSVEVYSLLFQTIHQIGPFNNITGAFNWRHDLDDTTVITVICSSIAKQLENSRKNWQRTHALAIMTMMLTSMAHLSNATLKDEIFATIRLCRTVALEWIETLRDLIAKGLLDNKPDEAELLRGHLVFSCIAVILTYDGPAEHLFSPADSLNLINSTVCLADNTIMSPTAGRSINNDLFSFSQLVTRVERILMSKIHVINSYVSKDTTILSAFTSRYWTPSTDGRLGKWAQEDQTNFWSAILSKRNEPDVLVQVNILDGVFLVNGDSNKRLPPTIEQSPGYQSIFGVSIFEVQSSGYRRWKMSRPFKNTLYEFILTPTNQVGIIEHYGQKGQIRYHIAAMDFKYDTPTLLHTKHSHWVNVEDQSIEFRALSFLDFALPPSYIGSLRTGTIVQTLTNSSVMSITSEDYIKITSFFERIEKKEMIHVLVNPTNAIVHLPRYGLDFIVTNGQHITCKQYPGYTISNNQHTGTLLGFTSYIVLKDANSDLANDKIIIPNAPIELVTSYIDSPHQITRSTLQLRSPPYFSYEVSKEFGILRATDILPQLFIAYLHAMTSSCMPDPFTAFTGLEASIEALQRFHSNIPFSAECLTVLDEISEISPKRHQYPLHLHHSVLQTVAWNTIVHPLVAHECLYLQVQHIVVNNDQLAVLHTPNAPHRKQWAPLSDRELYLISYNRWRHLLTPRLQTLTSLAAPHHPFDAQLFPPIALATASRVATNRAIDPAWMGGLLRTANLNGLQPAQVFSSPWSYRELTDSSKWDYWLTLYNITHLTQLGQFPLLSLTFLCTYLKWYYDLDGTFFDPFIAMASAPTCVAFPAVPTLDSDHFDNISCTYSRDMIEKQLEAIALKEKKKRDAANKFSDHKVRYTDDCSYASYRNLYDSLVPDSFWAFDRDLDDKCPLRPFLPVDLSISNLPNEFVNKVWSANLARFPYNAVPVFKGDLLPFSQKPVHQRYLAPVLECQGSDYADLWQTGYDERLEVLFDQCLVKMDQHEEISPKSVEFMDNIPPSTLSMAGYIINDLQASLVSLKDKFSHQECHQLATSETIHSSLHKVIQVADSSSSQLWETIQRYFTDKAKVNQSLIAVIGAYILIRSYRDKAIRCLNKTGEDLIKELVKSRRTQQWTPVEYPDWIMFELDQRIFIRDNQHRIASELIANPGCIQLQMGEGKTSVIFPLMFLAITRRSIAFRI